MPWHSCAHVVLYSHTVLMKFKEGKTDKKDGVRGAPQPLSTETPILSLGLRLFFFPIDNFVERVSQVARAGLKFYMQRRLTWNPLPSTSPVLAYECAPPHSGYLYHFL